MNLLHKATCVISIIIDMPTVAHARVIILYNGNHPQKKSFANFANLEAFANVFLHFLSRLEFLYNEIT